MQKKYKLTSNTKVILWTTLYQIEALISFGNVSKWDLGWWIEKETNLDQYWDARVYWNARVYWDARVSWNARVYWKLKLSLWFFFWIRCKKEEIKYVKLDDDNEIICKWYIKVETEEEKPSLKWKTVKVELDWVTYEAIIQ